MDTNTSEQLVALQQRIMQLEQFITQQQPQQQSSTAQPSAEQQQQPSYSWTPPPLLSEVLQLESSLFPATMLTDDERRKVIENYPNIDGVQCQPPDTIPMASRKMKPFQSKQDMSLKRLQYLISGVFRPMDVLGLEISKETDNQNVQRYLYMLRDCRSLLLNVSAQINEMRNTLAIQAINPTFSSPSGGNANYTMAPADFQALLVQQTAAAQAVQKATGGAFKNKKRFNNNNNFYQQQTCCDRAYIQI
ncbi:hypothetical protein INT47_004926 [Mucor saturninus]|uniref:Uncharacterized protein n=1 Tax=Mucor saturninus TaxID=64648 RepID=A0A8H7R276_9FUNG|nr:hypothetical protein INT47_004926 [Mucor saturninus]